MNVCDTYASSWHNVLSHWKREDIFDRESEARGPRSLIIVVVGIVWILKCSVMLPR